jgi:hypothetical protein
MIGLVNVGLYFQRRWFGNEPIPNINTSENARA